MQFTSDGANGKLRGSNADSGYPNRRPWRRPGQRRHISSTIKAVERSSAAMASARSRWYVRQCIQRGFSGNGSRMFALPPRRILIFCTRLMARSRGFSFWVCRSARSNGGMQIGRLHRTASQRADHSSSSAQLLGGCRSRFAATPRRGRCDHFGSRRRHDGLPRSPEAELVCHRRTPLRIGRCGQRMIRRQFPVSAIRRRFEPMSVAQTPPQHQATKPAFEADDMVVLHRSPNRDCRRQRDRLRRALAEATERTMHRRNQSRKLINGDTILRDITTDDLRYQAGINLLRRLQQRLYAPAVGCAGR